MKTSLFNPDLKIPVDTDGNIDHTISCKDTLTWNFYFNGNITIDRLVREDHKMYLEITIYDILCQKSYKASMFFSEFIDMMKKVNIKKGTIKGKFTFMQRGTAFGLRYLGEVD